MEESVYTELVRIQQALEVPKSQYNKFGKFYYRSCEDILNAVKPLLGECTLVITDEVVNIGSRNYVKATAEFWFNKSRIGVQAFACEAESKSGMDSAQITGAASSYARKYALNGLFLIDDGDDPDSKNNKEVESNSKGTSESSDKPWFNDIPKALDAIARATSFEEAQEILGKAKKKYKISKKNLGILEEAVNSFGKVNPNDIPDNL